MYPCENFQPVKHVCLFLVFLCALGLLGGAPIQAEVLAQYPINDRLAAKIEDRKDKNAFFCQGELVCGIAEMPIFYRRRNFSPAWFDTDLNFALAEKLVAAIKESEAEGLNPQDYHLARLKSIVMEMRGQQATNIPVDQNLLVDLDILLTDAFLMLGSHYRAGRVNPETIHAEWSVFVPEVDMSAKLQEALDTGQISPVLKTLLPPHAGYKKLRQALAELKKLRDKGGFVAIPDGSTLREGDSGIWVVLLRRHLWARRDFESANEMFSNPDHDDYFFDAALTEAVKRFQKRHGLETDGAVGRRTLAALNVTIEDRIHQAKLNLERWRWIPHDLGLRYVLVNIADFKLTVFEADQPVMDMRVVVGRNYRETPVFSAPMRYIVVNPFWNVPQSLATKDILPKLKVDPDYIVTKKIKVFEGWYDNAQQLDPTLIDWSAVSPTNFRYKLRQDPGELNALGRIKFMFPNKHAVYLHDTPAKSLFKKIRRGYSSGCIRLEKPFDLAAYLLAENKNWSSESFKMAIEKGQRRIFQIESPTMVHLLYWTAWMGSDGRIQFRNDIYDRDSPLALALESQQPIKSDLKKL
jgi:L,D-transpeptidase YcbB